MHLLFYPGASSMAAPRVVVLLRLLVGRSGQRRTEGEEMEKGGGGGRGKGRARVR